MKAAPRKPKGETAKKKTGRGQAGLKHKPTRKSTSARGSRRLTVAQLLAGFGGKARQAKARHHQS